MGVFKVNAFKEAAAYHDSKSQMDDSYAKKHGKPALPQQRDGA